MRTVLALLAISLAMLLPAISLAYTVTYSYDETGRLEEANYGPAGSIEYTQDSRGNLLERTTNGESTSQAPSGGSDGGSGGGGCSCATLPTKQLGFWALLGLHGFWALPNRLLEPPWRFTGFHRF